jgi:hypothetical protein
MTMKAKPTTYYLVEAQGSLDGDQWGYQPDSLCTSRSAARRWLAADRKKDAWRGFEYRIVRLKFTGVVR